MKVLAFGTFHSRHAANALLLDDLRRAGAEVSFCHEPLWEETRDKADAYFGPWSLARLAGRYVVASWRLARRLAALAGSVDVVVAGFNGQLDVLLARLVLRLRRREPLLLFAPLVTVTETLVEDRAVYRRGTPVARALAALDRASLLASDVVLVDTGAHREWIQARFGVPPEILRVHPLGAEAAFAPRPGVDDASREASGGARPMRVLFYGSYLPLHGMRVIADAAAELGPQAGVEFEWIGSGPERAAIDARGAGLAHVRRVDWVPYEELPGRIAASDVVLGIFGESVKAAMVIPNKVWQAASSGRAVVTADTPAVREVFRPGESIVVVPPVAEALAGALRELRDDPLRRRAIGASAALAARRAAGPEVRAARLHEVLESAAAAAALSADGRAPTFAAGPPRVGVVVVTWEGAAVTRACVESVRRSLAIAPRIFVVDNGSSSPERARLRGDWDGQPDVELVLLDENRHFAGGVNAGAKRALDWGADHLVFLNNDTVLEPGCLRLLVATAEKRPGAGIVGPALLDIGPDARVLSLGERYSTWSVCLPRSLLRVRSRGDGRSYRVGGVMGSALLVTRRCFEAVGPYREDLQVYYEEVDYCLRARARGYRPRIVPDAVVRHDGMRGFAAGLQPYAAYLKCRNLPLLARDHGTPLDRLAFAPSYLALLLASSALYAARGNLAVVRAMWRGARDAWRAGRGAPLASGVPRR